MELFESIKYPQPKVDQKLILQYRVMEDSVTRQLIDLQDSAYWRGVEVGLQYARDHGWIEPKARNDSTS